MGNGPHRPFAAKVYATALHGVDGQGSILGAVMSSSIMVTGALLELEHMLIADFGEPEEEDLVQAASRH
jgi:hypothetical protein